MGSSIYSSTVPAGINQDSLKFESPVRNIVITGISETFSDIANFKNLAQWKTKLQTLLAWMPASLSGYEPRTDDPSESTSTFGKKLITRAATPSMMVNLESNVADFNHLLGTLEGGNYRVFFLHEDGTISAYRTGTGVFKGFKAKITAITKGVPPTEGLEVAFPVYINFVDLEEFKAKKVINPAWNPLLELPAAMPNGLSLEATGVYDTAGDGDITVHIEDRCGDGVTGLDETNMEVVTSNDLDTPAVSAATDDGGGDYTVTLAKGAAPASLSSGDYIVFRVKVISTGSIVSDVSNNLLVVAP